MQDIALNVPLDLNTTLNCGQAFRWDKSGDCWKGVVRSTALKLFQNEKKITVISSSPELLGMELDSGLAYYFGLDHDLGSIHSTLRTISKGFESRTCKIIDSALTEARGLRILRQDPFETTIEYMISARNSIPAIKRSIEKLASRFPENLVELDGESFYLFPELEQMKLLTIDDLERLSLGFRSEWVHGLVQSLEDERLFAELNKVSLEEKLQELMKVRGIGCKIASCVALFSMSELNAFPADVWILRMMNDLFGITGTTQVVTETGMSMFSPYAGYMQEALYRYYRENKLGRTK